MQNRQSERMVTTVYITVLSFKIVNRIITGFYHSVKYKQYDESEIILFLLS